MPMAGSQSGGAVAATQAGRLMVEEAHAVVGLDQVVLVACVRDALVLHRPAWLRHVPATHTHT